MYDSFPRNLAGDVFLTHVDHSRHHATPVPLCDRAVRRASQTTPVVANRNKYAV